MTFKKLVIWFGSIGSIASIVSLLFIFIPRNENIELLVNTQSVERLTQTFEDKEPNLKVNYKFKGTEIKNLWKYNILFKNNSKKTIIGNGNQKNILMDNFTLKLKKGYEILDYKKIKSDFNNNLTVDSANVKIFFEQWRGNEILEYSFYIKTDIKKADTLLLEQPEFRQIIDGDIFFNKNELSNKKDRITQFIPQKYRLAGYVISMIFLGLFIIMLSMFIFLTPFSYYKINKWRANNESKYNSLIEKVFEDDSEKKDKLISNPDYAPDSFWEKFDGEKFPNVSVQLDMNKIYQPIIAVVIISIINISLIIAFMELIYLF